MFLWVTDFYSLEKIISAFPKIVLLYLKMTGDRNRRVGAGSGGKMDGGRETDGELEAGLRGICAAGEREGRRKRSCCRSLNPGSPSRPQRHTLDGELLRSREDGG